MALVSRLQFSCYLDSTKRPGWNPDFVGEIIDLGGQSAAIVMDNGTGKTTVADGLLWLLSQDNTLRDRVRDKLAPASFGYSSHIRVEMVIPRGPDPDLFVAIGDRIPGEHHVLGAYACREPGGRSIDSTLYYYPGRLEDVPVHTETVLPDGQVRKGMVPDAVFAASLPPGSIVPRRADWLSRVDQFIPRQQIAQMVDYQKRGGGDKAASFYDITSRKREEFDRAFFRRCVAPEVLQGVIDDTGIEEQGPREVPFETGIVEHANAVVRAKVETEDKRGRLDAMEQSIKVLERLDGHAGKVVSSRDKLEDAKRRQARNVAQVRSVLASLSVPGLPAPVMFLAGLGLTLNDIGIMEETAFADSWGVVIGSGLLSSRGLEGVQRRERNFRETSVILPLTIPTKIEAGIRYYPVDMLSDKVMAYPGDEEKLTKLIVDVRSVVTSHSRHPIRIRLRQVAHNINENEIESSSLDRLLSQLSNKQNSLAEELASYDSDQEAFNRIAASGLFTDLELQAPGGLEADVQQQKAACDEAVTAHVVRHASLQPAKQDFDAVLNEFGSGEVEALEAELNAARENAGKAESEAKDKLDKAAGSLHAAEANRKDSSEKLDACSQQERDLAE